MCNRNQSVQAAGLAEAPWEAELETQALWHSLRESPLQIL